MEMEDSSMTVVVVKKQYLNIETKMKLSFPFYPSRS